MNTFTKNGSEFFFSICIKDFSLLEYFFLWNDCCLGLLMYDGKGRKKNVEENVKLSKEIR
jgi:hypothetical protein